MHHKSIFRALSESFTTCNTQELRSTDLSQTSTGTLDFKIFKRTVSSCCILGGIKHTAGISDRLVLPNHVQLLITKEVLDKLEHTEPCWALYPLHKAGITGACCCTQVWLCVLRPNLVTSRLFSCSSARSLTTRDPGRQRTCLCPAGLHTCESKICRCAWAGRTGRSRRLLHPVLSHFLCTKSLAASMRQHKRCCCRLYVSVAC